MTLHSVLSSVTMAASAVVHPLAPALTATQLALTVGVGGVAALALRARRRRPVGAVPEAKQSYGAASAARRDGDDTAPTAEVMTCRPQLLTPPGTARARGQVEQWLARGELDPETYGDLRRVFAEVEAARD